MARIAGVNIPDNKRIEIALTYIFGIGKSVSGVILDELKIGKDIRAKDLTSEQVNSLKNYIEEKYKIEGELKHEIRMNIRRLKEIGCYRGARHQKGLPSRGQRTKTNNRTIRGNVRKTTGSGRRSVEKT
ncbi:MAG: 30S ribosomal protein S13 [Candidatus Moranbacteria bacterium]|jgi:small subunit ribosomal protein S13|nr:30S ribosomal protein S13 [Candidatus Moranbacteria bacterium]